MSVEVVIPFAGDCPHRQRALEWVLPRYPWPVTVSRGRRTDTWCKARVVAPAVSRSCADVIVIADADCFTEGLTEAVGRVQNGAPFAIPHGHVHRLTEQATSDVIDGADWTGQPLDQKPYHGIPGGGFVVARREVIRSIPLDGRFVGWGQEDEAWAMALTALAGVPWRGNEPLVHLWHPPQERLSRRRGSKEAWQLRRRYFAARHDRAAMQRLIDEAHALHPPQPSLHDLEPYRVG